MTDIFKFSLEIGEFYVFFINLDFFFHFMMNVIHEIKTESLFIKYHILKKLPVFKNYV